MKADCRDLSFQRVPVQRRFGIRQIFRRDKEQIGFTGSTGEQALAALPDCYHALIRIFRDRAQGYLTGGDLLVLYGSQDKAAVQVFHIRKQNAVIIFHLQGDFPDQETVVPIIKKDRYIRAFIFPGLTGRRTVICGLLSACLCLFRLFPDSRVSRPVRTVRSGTFRFGRHILCPAVPDRCVLLRILRSPDGFPVIP